MKAILLSIKPKFVNEIRAEKKTFEFRKSIYKNNSIQKMLIYSSFPEQKIVALCDIEEVLSDFPDEIWLKTKHSSGITKDFFDEYFSGRDTAYAIKIGNVHFFDNPLELIDFGVKRAPQSFMYVDLTELV